MNRTVIGVGIVVGLLVTAYAAGRKPASAPVYSLIGLTKFDWQENVISTDSEWFYLDTDRSS